MPGHKEFVVKCIIKTAARFLSGCKLWVKRDSEIILGWIGLNRVAWKCSLTFGMMLASAHKDWKPHCISK